jgi:hypothetical protein
MRDNDRTKAQEHDRNRSSDPDRVVRALMKKTGTSYSQVLACCTDTAVTAR